MNNKTLLKAWLSVTSIIAFGFFFLASVTMSQTKITIPVKVANFAFTPDSTAPPKSQKLSFVLISPSYADNFYYSGYSPFSDFAKAMTQDIEETIIARGYSIFGPYSTPDEMVYSDKINSDIILYINIEPEINVQNVKTHQKYQYDWKAGAYYTYTFSGNIILSGTINMTAQAVWNQEKLWKKSIPLEQKSMEITSTKSYTENDFKQPFVYSDGGVINPIVDALEQYYGYIMKMVYAHLDPEEMKNVKKQADEIKATYKK